MVDWLAESGVLEALSHMSLFKQLPEEPVCSVGWQIFFTPRQSELRLLFGLIRRRGSVVRGDDRPFHFIGSSTLPTSCTDRIGSAAWPTNSRRLLVVAPRRAAGLLARVVLCDRRSEQVKSSSVVHHGHCRGDGEHREEWRRDLKDAHERAGYLSSIMESGKWHD